MTRRWLLAWGLAAVAFGGSSLIVPLYVVALGGDAFDLGLLFATSSFVGVPGALLCGTLVDRTGRRRVFVLTALALVAVSMGAIPLFDTIVPVLVAYAVLWFAYAAAVPVLTVLAVAETPAGGWSKQLARLNRVQSVGWTVGLALGFVVTTGATATVGTITAQRVFFLVCGASAALGVAVAGRTLPSDPPAGTTAEGSVSRGLRARFGRGAVRGAGLPFVPSRFDPRRFSPRRLVRRFTPRLGLYFVAVFLVFTGFGVFLAPLPVYLSAVGYGTGAIFGFYLLLYASATVFFGRAAILAGQYGLGRVNAASLFVRGAALPLVLVVEGAGTTPAGFGALGTVFLVLGLTWAVVVVTAATLVTQLAPEAIRGEAHGVYNALIAVGGGVGGLLGGWLAGLGYAVAFGTAGVLVVAGAATVASLNSPP
jgi:MFS family permease